MSIELRMRPDFFRLNFFQHIFHLWGICAFVILAACTPLEEPKQKFKISGISPASGLIEGDYVVTITGTDFYKIESVKFADKLCGDLSVSAEKITCVVPATITPGLVDVVVKGKTATQTTSFTYTSTAPTLTSFTPASGPVAGGAIIFLYGSGFVSGMDVEIGGVDCDYINILSSSVIECSTPALPAGAYPVEVINPVGQSAVAPTSYVYNPPPTVTSVSPSEGLSMGGDTLTITGTGFLEGARVKIGTFACGTVDVIDANNLTCVTISGVTGSYDVTVRNTDTQSGTLTNAFNFYSPPVISAISPVAGQLAGGTTVTITGNHFTADTTMTIGGLNCTSFTVVSSNTLTCVTPANPAGAYPVTVNNPVSSATYNSYTYQPAPTVSGVSPTAGPLAGGTTLTITGTDFLSGATVLVGASACTVTAVTATSITCVTTAQVAGTYGVTVANFDSQSHTLPASFTYQPAPTITSLSPAGGTALGGTTLTITGTGFVSGASVDLGGVACVVGAVTATTITCTTGAHTAETVDVTVSNTDGQSVVSTAAYTYLDAPTISSIVPAAGSLSGGTTITINGTEFFPGATVTIDGNACTGVTVSSSSSLTCSTPAGTAGARDVVVTNIDSQTVTSTGGYTYQAGPTITSIAPTSGPTAGGTAITITGSDFISGATVDIGGTACASPVTTATTITCTTAATSAGSKTVTVTNPDNQIDSVAAGFLFSDPPTIASVVPDAGAIAGGTTITITGTDFVSGSVVTLDSLPCTSQTVVSSTSITCVTPAHAVGAVSLAVTNPDAANASSTYTYQLAPTVTSVAPSNGPMSGGTVVTVNGSDFLTGATVDFGGSGCTVSAVSATSITCTTTAHATGAVTVTVTNTDNQSGTLATGFTFDPAPTLSSISPLLGPSSGGTTLTLTGANFVAGAAVSIGGAACTVTAESSTSITCTTGAGTAGAQVVTITNPDGQSDTYASLTYLNAPTLASISPVGGPLSGGTSVTITGTDFFTGATVTFNGTTCSGTTVVNSTTITCTTPAGLAGAATVVVTNVDGQNVSSSTLYTYANAPSVTGTSPAYGPIGGGTAVTITGSGFQNGATATFGGSAPVSCTFNSINSLTCTSPLSVVSGLVSVKVTNPDTQSGTLADAFTYLKQPTVTSISPNKGKASGNTTVTILGTDFYTGATVSLGGTACNSVSVVSSSAITCVTAAHTAGVVNVVVTNVDTQTGTLTNGFEYLNPPTVTAISPASGNYNGGNSVTITGTNFSSGATVSIGGNTCTGVTVVSASQITCTTGAGAVGSFKVTATNVDGQSGTSAVDIFTYRLNTVINNVSPVAGPATGGGTFTINGSGFGSGDTVAIGGTACTPVTVVSSTQLTCPIPPKAAGTYDVVVTTPYGATATKSAAYTYRNAATISSVSPASGPLTGDTLITITGTNFAAGTTVTFGGNNCTSLSVASATTITCRTPAGTAGAKTLSLTVPGMTAVNSSYTYAATPVVEFVVGSMSPTPPNPDSYGTTSTNVSHIYTVKNKGDATSGTLTMSLTGADASAWVIGVDECSGNTLVANASCAVQVTFRGGFLSSGNYSATLNVSSTPGGSSTNSLEGSVP